MDTLKVTFDPIRNFVEERLGKGHSNQGDGEDQPLNERPIIGIIAQPFNSTIPNYIMAAYIKFIEQAGARVVPVFASDSDETILDLMSKINGIVFPGGSTELNHEDGSLTPYSLKGKMILDKVKEMNDAGIHFPVWAICLGIQEVAVIEAPFPDVLMHDAFDSYNVANNVTFKSEMSQSRMYKNIPQHIFIAMQNENITFNSHHDGLYPEVFRKYPGLQDYNVLAVSYDKKGVEYVASIEHKKYPIYGHQYHPEKNAFIWYKELVVPHTQNAIALEQYYANFFVTEAKRNHNAFTSEEEEFDHMIENYEVEFLADKEAQDVYVFYN